MGFELTSGIPGALMKIDQLLIVVGIFFQAGSSLLLMAEKLEH